MHQRIRVDHHATHYRRCARRDIALDVDLVQRNGFDQAGVREAKVAILAHSHRTGRNPAAVHLDLELDARARNAGGRAFHVHIAADAKGGQWFDGDGLDDLIRAPFGASGDQQDLIRSRFGVQVVGVDFGRGLAVAEIPPVAERRAVGNRREIGQVEDLSFIDQGVAPRNRPLEMDSPLPQRRPNPSNRLARR